MSEANRGAVMQDLIGAAMFILGLLAMLASYLLAFGCGLTSGLIVAVAAPPLVVGIGLDHTPARAAVFAIGVAMGCGWLCLIIASD